MLVKTVSGFNANTSELQTRLLENLSQLESDESKSDETRWEAVEIHDVSRMDGLMTKAALTSDLRQLEEMGLVNSERVLYSAWLKWQLTARGLEHVGH